MISKFNNLIMRFPPIIRYFASSCLVTIIDVVIVWILNIGFNVNLVTANTIGVITGFIIDYFISAQYVFLNAKNKIGFCVYLITFVFGLGFANIIIYICNTMIFNVLSESLNLLFSKGVSIVIPFFFLYFIRKIIYNLLDRDNLQQHINRNEVEHGQK